MQQHTTLSEAELDVTAYMARLRLSSAERERLRTEVQQILSYFDLMAALDVSGVEPTTHALQPRNRLRPDRVVAADRRWPGTTPERLLDAAPHRGTWSCFRNIEGNQLRSVTTNAWTGVPLLHSV